MRKILLALGIMALICTPAMAGPNANGAIVVHTDDAYTYLSTTVCTTAMPAECELLGTQTNKLLPAQSVVWFLAAFLPTAIPRVAVVYFGHNYDDSIATGLLDITGKFGMCAPAGSLEAPDATWPADNNSGTTVGFGTPIIGDTLFPFYYFRVDNYDDAPGGIDPYLCSDINPTGGYAAFFDDAFPAAQDNITQFGCVNWYVPGHNQCPVPGVVTGACCLTTGECILLTQADCLAHPLYYEYKGDDTVCVPDNPCVQPGACCDLETGACTFVLPVNCQPPLVFVGGDCAPINPCPQKGACCEPLTGNCTYVLQEQCLAPSVWHPEWTCNPNNCPVEPLGACCAPDGSCTYVYASQCPPPSIWHGDWTCTPSQCPPPTATEPDRKSVV